MTPAVEKEFDDWLDRYMEQWREDAQSHFEEVGDDDDAKQGNGKAENKSLNGYHVKAGFTGERRDKLGRRNCYSDGRRTACRAPTAKQRERGSVQERMERHKPKPKGPEKHEVQRAWSTRDDEALTGIMETVKTAGTKRGGNLGLVGMRSIAKEVGLKGASGLKKAQLAIALYDHLKAGMKEAPVLELKARLDRIALAEQGTGVAFKDRLIDALLSINGTSREPRYQEALAEMAKGEGANRQDVTYLRTTRANALRDLKESDVDGPRLRSLLQSIADGGYGSLKPSELADYLAGRLEPGSARRAEDSIIPDDIRLAPAPKRRKEGKRERKEPDYIDRVQAPIESRLKKIKAREAASSIPFMARVVEALAVDPRITHFPGKPEYQAMLDKRSQGERMTAQENRAMSDFRASVFGAMKREDIQPKIVQDALERLDAANHGTLNYNELLHLARKPKVGR